MSFQTTSQPQKIQQIFQFSGSQRYIQLIQRESQQPQHILSHFILDTDLSIIQKQKQYINLYKNQSQRSSKGTQQDEQQCWIIKQSKKKPIYFKYYKKYCQSSDFIFGREHWGREYNCLRIVSDMISRRHAEIYYNCNPLMNDKDKIIRNVKDILLPYANYSSALNRVTYWMWEKIIEYAGHKPKYTIKDCNSRNGTFLIDSAAQCVAMKEGEGYQFQFRGNYLINVSQIIEGSYSEVQQRLQQCQNIFKAKSIYSHSYQFIILKPQNHLYHQELVQKTFSAINFQIQLSHELKYFFFIIICTQDEEQFPIGQGHRIAISSDPNRMGYQSSRHGMIAYRGKEWLLYPSSNNQMIWVKIKTEEEYELRPQKKYRLRLGHYSNVIDINFHHFSCC